ncbi:hypothetical protein CDAR_259191 [Caerostris darwini]|uniref:Uncharacterized protein n=1 Tax=Caerostris darwini TaxID=1538125 RepID=A0AAV4MA70_9ARAC|nr:hypothetical protein CDAR_259191 [Caerostris darwini]
MIYTSDINNLKISNSSALFLCGFSFVRSLISPSLQFVHPSEGGKHFLNKQRNPFHPLPKKNPSSNRPLFRSDSSHSDLLLLLHFSSCIVQKVKKRHFPLHPRGHADEPSTHQKISRGKAPLPKETLLRITPLSARGQPFR